MGKKNKFQPNGQSVGRSTPQQSPANPRPDIKPALAAARDLMAEGFVVQWDGDEKLFGVLHDALPADKQSSLQDFLNKLAEFGKQVKGKTQEFNALVAAKNAELLEKEEKNVSDRDSIAADKAQLVIDQEALNKQREEVNADKQKVQSETVRLSNLERSLLAREEDAKSGFAKLNDESMRALRETIANLHLSKIALDSEIHDARTTAFKQLEEEIKVRRTQLLESQGEIDDETSALSAGQKLLEEQRREFEREKKTYEDLKRLLRGEVQKEFDALLATKSQENLKLKTREGQIQEETDRLLGDLDAFKDLIEQSGGMSGQEITGELTRLRAAAKADAKQIRLLQSQQAADDRDQIIRERDQLRVDVQELTRSVEELRQKEHLRHLGVLEKERLGQEKSILEKSKQLLSAHISDLESRIKNLTESQQAQNAFPELSRMDVENTFRMPAPVQPIVNLAEFTKELRHRIAASQPDNPLYFREQDLRLFVGGLAMSQLHVLQGISGTGKTSLAKAFATAVGGTCRDIAVQAGWRDRGDLLGHYNAFEKRYYEKECLQALYLSQTPCAEDRINVILLDEMNLSRPEQYFADFLSALEKPVQARYIPLIESAPPNPPKKLNEGREIFVPENVWFIGTANQDETTSELADKTQDRAFVMELPRQEDDFSIDRGLDPFTCSFESLRKAFVACQKTDRKVVQKAMLTIRKSELTTELAVRFGLGWGNRFERQALKFLPVVKACGGTHENALDHLMATRVFRKGKVTDRYDIKLDDLEAIEKALLNTWKEIFPGTSPEFCKEAIQKDRKRLERLELHG
jgi:hypothetical protein